MSLALAGLMVVFTCAPSLPSPQYVKKIYTLSKASWHFSELEALIYAEC